MNDPEKFESLRNLSWFRIYFIYTGGQKEERRGNKIIVDPTRGSGGGLVRS